MAPKTAISRVLQLHGEGYTEKAARAKLKAEGYKLPRIAQIMKHWPAAPAAPSADMPVPSAPQPANNTKRRRIMHKQGQQLVIEDEAAAVAKPDEDAPQPANNPKRRRIMHKQGPPLVIEDNTAVLAKPGMCATASGE